MVYFKQILLCFFFTISEKIEESSQQERKKDACSDFVVITAQALIQAMFIFACICSRVVCCSSPGTKTIYIVSGKV